MNATLQSNVRTRAATKRRPLWRRGTVLAAAVVLLAGAAAGGWLLLDRRGGAAGRPTHCHGRAWRYRGQHDSAGQPAAARLCRCRHAGLGPAPEAVFRHRLRRSRRARCWRRSIRPSTCRGSRPTRRSSSTSAPSSPTSRRSTRWRSSSSSASRTCRGERHEPGGAAERRGDDALGAAQVDALRAQIQQTESTLGATRPISATPRSTRRWPARSCRRPRSRARR